MKSCSSPKAGREKTEEAVKALFHRLWSKDVGSPGYDKKAWMELQRLLNDLGVPV